MRKRSTLDIVVILFAVMVAFTVFSATVGIIIGKILRPEMDVTRGSEIIGGMLDTIIGALIGFIGGRAVGRSEANGEDKK
jgi:hypothetical protein